MVLRTNHQASSMKASQENDENKTYEKDQQEDNNIDKYTYHNEDIYKSAEHKELQRLNAIYKKLKTKLNVIIIHVMKVMKSSNEIKMKMMKII